jgi:hypothetical protein
MSRLHPLAGVVALATILTFWTSTVTAELFGGPATIALVKQGVLWGFLILIPAVITAAATGRAGAAASGRRARGKAIRTRIIAANGVLILAPAAIYLYLSASSGTFDTAFVAVQLVELAAGAVNAVLLTLNIRDGHRLAH